MTALGEASSPTAQSPPHWLRLSLARFGRMLPAFLGALLVVRGMELWAGTAADSTWPAVLRLTAQALLHDLFAVLRFMPLLCVLTLPLLGLRGRGRLLAVGLWWSLFLLAHAGLIQYFLIARTPLGADVFGYSVSELRQTVSAVGISIRGVLTLLLPLLVLWALLAWRERGPLPNPGGRWSVVALFFAVVATLFRPTLENGIRYDNEDAHNLARNKAAFFIDDVSQWLLPGSAPQAVSALPESGADGDLRYLDPRYPFLREERTPDVLGPRFSASATPPSIVFVVVEGLGRSFSGHDAVLGSFTPFLDELAERSLYFDNFIAPQGRTFGVLPSLLGSLPFADTGFADLGAAMPVHLSLPGLLHRQGYRVMIHAGFDLGFDNTGLFMAREGADLRVGPKQFGADYAHSHETNSWGFADAALYRRALADLRAQTTPFVSVIQTISMHTPYIVPGQAALAATFEQRLDTLGIAPERKANYRAHRDIYTTILYADRSLREFFAAYQREPMFADTIFVITGDHRLPEIPMATRIERYHVPMLIYSPRLRTPGRVRAVSSHFDVAPSLLAFLSHHHSIRTPAAVTWLGSGLDLSPVFRNGHDIPLKQTKTRLDDFISATWYYSQQRLYAIGPTMQIEPATDRVVQQQLQRRFARFVEVNAQLVRDGTLMPPRTTPLLPWEKTSRDPLPSDAVPGVSLTTEAVTVPPHAEPGGLVIEVNFSNAGSRDAPAFVPLLVLADEAGRALTESYGRALTLSAGGRVRLTLPVRSVLPAGRYYLSVVPSHPDTGKPVGAGRYRMPVELGGANSVNSPPQAPP